MESMITVNFKNTSHKPGWEWQLNLWVLECV